jgi:hypothetical protein
LNIKLHARFSGVFLAFRFGDSIEIVLRFTKKNIELFRFVQTSILTMTILCIGINHHTAPLPTRGAFAIAGEEARDAMLRLIGHPAIDEAAGSRAETLLEHDLVGLS